MIRIELLPRTFRAEAEYLLSHGGGTNSWDVLQAIVRIARESGITDVEFFREDHWRNAGPRVVTYDLESMEICINENIECRPAERREK